MLKSASLPISGKRARPEEVHDRVRVVPLYYALIHLQYMQELDTFPKQRADLAAIIQRATPRSIYHPWPITVEISNEVFECIQNINVRQAISVLEQRYDEEIAKVEPCNDS